MGYVIALTVGALTIISRWKDMRTYFRRRRWVPYFVLVLVFFLIFHFVLRVSYWSYLSYSILHVTENDVVGYMKPNQSVIFAMQDFIYYKRFVAASYSHPHFYIIKLLQDGGLYSFLVYPIGAFVIALFWTYGHEVLEVLRLRVPEIVCRKMRKSDCNKANSSTPAGSIDWSMENL